MDGTGLVEESVAEREGRGPGRSGGSAGSNIGTAKSVASSGLSSILTSKQKGPCLEHISITVCTTAHRSQEVHLITGAAELHVHLPKIHSAPLILISSTMATATEAVII